LIVPDYPFHRTAEQAVLLVQQLDVDLTGDLVDDRGSRERPGEREGAADPDRRPGRSGGSLCGEQRAAKRKGASFQTHGVTSSM